MFSFHVHEKSILFPLLPMTLLLADGYHHFGLMINLVASFSMSPLLIREGLLIPYLALNLGYWLFLAQVYTLRNIYITILLVIMGGLHLLPMVVNPPANYPFLFPLLITFFSFLNFMGAYLYGNFFLHFHGRPIPKKSK